MGADSSPPLTADRNLLFGILALQMDFISRDALVAAMNAWVLHKTKPLGQILEEQGALRPADRGLLENVVQRHLQMHGDDAERSLASLGSVGSLAEYLPTTDSQLRASLAFLSAAGIQGNEAAATRPPAVGQASVPGRRFRILREHAKGGLGAVFLALDEELHRQVALKEIQERYADHPESRSRFLLEAEVTGGLEHPGIVPVYGLGYYPDGRPFYAMRFIKGDSFHQAIRRFHTADGTSRDPGERSLAFREQLARFVAACNALAYAHARGVLHRDIKPQNIMLGKYGETLLVDWGLAKVIGHREGLKGSEEGTLHPLTGQDTAPTQLGNIMGTPAYMSPEQAEGRLEELGPASDIYSLGATLYELLTGQEPVQGKSLEEIFTKTKQGEWLPPRKVRKEVPAALDAICRKALALRPEERYASALELAADIEHWLADEPVSAYREPWTGRMRRWLRRNRGLVAGGAGLVVTTLVALAVGLVAVERQKRRAEQALLAEAQAKRWTRQALDEMSSEAIENWLSRQKGKLEPAQEEFLKKALAYYEAFAQETGEDEATRASVAKAHLRTGIILARLGRHQAAEEAYRRALAAYQHLAADFPTVASYRLQTGKTYHNLGKLLADTGRPHQAEEAYQEGIGLYQGLVAAFPKEPAYRLMLAQSHNNLGDLLAHTGRSQQAEAALRKALALYHQLAADSPAKPEYRQEMARSQLNLGNLLQKTGRLREAENAYRDALALQKNLTAEFPNVPAYRQEQALCQNNLGILLKGMGRLQEAETVYRDALGVCKRLVAELPAVPDYRHLLAMIHFNLGNVLSETGRMQEAEAAYREGLALQKQLVTEFPEVPDYRRKLAQSHNSLGNVLRRTGRFPEAEAAYRDALALYRQLAAELPKVPDYRKELAMGHNNLGLLLGTRGRPQQAEASYREAIALYQQLVTASPNVPGNRQELARSLHNLGNLLANTDRPQEAEEAYRQALAIRNSLAADFPKVPDYQNDLAGTMGDLAELLRDRKQFSEARMLLEGATPHHQAALKANSRNPVYRNYYRNNLGVLVSVLAGLGDPPGASQTAEQLAALGWDPAVDAYDAACALAQCIPVAKKDVQHPQSTPEELVQSYTDRALAMLRRAIAKGYKDVENMKKDKDLDPLRTSPEFQKLLQELQGKTAKK